MNTTKHKTYFKTCFSILFYALTLFLITSCTENGARDLYDSVAQPDPPLDLKYRSGFFNGKVLIIKNMSEKTQSISIEVKRNEQNTWLDMGGGWLSASEEKEIGGLELKDGKNFNKGDKVIIRCKGYRKPLQLDF